MIKVELKGGVINEYEAGISAAEIAKSLGAGLYKAVCACKIDGVVCDLRTTLNTDAKLELLTFDDEEGKAAFWHTCSHVLAQAVKHLYPNAKLGVGPSIENGFFYDFEVDKAFSPEDLEKIKAEMKKIVKEGLELERFELEADEAVKMLSDMGEEYKVELAKEHIEKGDKLTFYKQGDFTDLCAGPHLMSVAALKAIELTNCTGAYWRGNAENAQMCRVYGIAFPKASQLTEYIEMVEQARLRDHNKIGRELELFTTSEVIGQGLPILLPKGARIIQLLQRFVEDEEQRRGWQLTKTPLMAKSDLYKKVSGIASVANIPEIQMQAELINKILHTSYVEDAGIEEFEHIRKNLRGLMKYLPKISVRYDTDFSDEILSVEWKESELENDELKNYKAKAEYYVRQHQDNIVIAKLKTNRPLTISDISVLEDILWKEIGTKAEYEAEYGSKPLGEFVREIVGLDMNAAKEAFSEFLNETNMDSRQIYFVNQIVEYIVHNGIMKDLSVLLESPFTDKGSVVEIFTDLNLWMGIRKVIEQINTNAVA